VSDIDRPDARRGSVEGTWVLLFMILVLMIVLTLSALFAAIANEQAEDSLALFAHRRLELQSKRRDGRCANEIQEAEEMLSVASDQLEILNRVYDACGRAETSPRRAPRMGPSQSTAGARLWNEGGRWHGAVVRLLWGDLLCLRVLPAVRY